MPITSEITNERKIETSRVKKLLNITKKDAKKTSAKKRYCAEKDKTNKLLINTEIKTNQIVREFFFKEKTKKIIKTNTNEILILLFIPFRNSQFFISLNFEKFMISE